MAFTSTLTELRSPAVRPAAPPDAGERLGLTQPAVSHALRRLRDHFNDPLFVRASNRMLPTDMAVQLHQPLDQAFAIINRALKERAAFDPALTRRRFRVAMSDIAEVYALPRLITKLARIAPGLRIDVVPFVPDGVVAAMRPIGWRSTAHAEA